MLEDFIDAIQNFRRNKTRTFLSLLGVIIGVASVIVITSMGKSSTQQIKETFGSSGLDVVSVSSGFMRRKRDAASIQFNESFSETLFGELKNIRRIWFKNTLSATLSYNDTSSNVSCSAVETGYLEMYGLSLDYGRYFSVTDNEEGCQKIILGSTIATALFPAGDGEGKHIILTTNKVSFSFEVIGVLKKQTSGMEDSENSAFIPIGFYSKKIKPNPNADMMMVQVTSPDKASSVTTAIEEYCKNKTGTDYSVNVMSMQTMIEQMNSITTTMSVMLSAIAAISLIVGGIGIMNIMIVTLGASPGDIRRQFLVESAAITLIGGSIGCFSGIMISLAVEYVRSLSYIVSWQACLIAFIFSVFVGIFFGLNPAARAARLDPVLALAGE